ncbi:MAG: hypothetical protein Ct9H90mP20_4070 [Candidatus Neomarinimicrobiota bacterium]|nr:MAG: hypothetical protein Ct9H90mP20_4070 [Candidatus Neomarinimicrobiota bacterium]
MADNNCKITVFPAKTTAEEIIEYNPQGVFLSNGPGDPAAVAYGIEMVKKLLGKKPIFGICLGHQILSLALGAKTFKLKFGHRGINHPVKNMNSGSLKSQVKIMDLQWILNSLPKNVKSTHINLNDNTSAGIECEELQPFFCSIPP